MNLNLDTIKSDKVQKIAEGEVAVSTVIAEGDTIVRVLALTADCRILSLEAIGNQIAVSGIINYRFMYATAEGELKNLDYFADFVEKLDSTLDGMAKLFGRINIMDTQITVVGGLKINFRNVDRGFWNLPSDARDIPVDESLNTENTKLQAQSYIQQQGRPWSLQKRCKRALKLTRCFCLITAE
jgi:hypothetical protein